MNSIESSVLNSYPLDINDVYWQVDDFKTQNKILAFEKAKGDVKKIKFVYYDNVFDSISWKEPETSIQTLMDEHAKSIRDRYKHVALWYSGGFDSNTILQVFIRNKLKIDEVILYKREWQPDYYNIEHDAAYQVAFKIKNKIWPNLKITSLPYTAKDTFNFYNSYGNDWIYNIIGESIYFSKTSRFNLWTTKEELYKNLDPYYRIDLDGVDKPRLALIDDNWYFFVRDKNLVGLLATNHEHFFMGKNAPLIAVKQAHMAASWFESLPNFSIGLMNYIQTQANPTPLYRIWNLSLGRSDAIDDFAKNNVIKIGFYQHFNVNRMESLLLLNKDYDKNINTIYSTGLKEIKKYCIDGDIKKGLPFVDSKKYFLRKAKFHEQAINNSQEEKFLNGFC